MELFNYSAKNKKGETQKGEIEAENEMAAAKILASKDLIPINIVSVASSSFNLFNGVSAKDKAFLMRQLATMVAAGLPLAQSLKTLEEQAIKSSIKKMLAQILSDIEGGTTLSIAMSRFNKVFSNIDITLIRSGETSGNLDKALNQMAHQLEKNLSLTRRIRGALIYPLFVLVVAIGITTYIVIVIVPQMQTLYDSFGKDLPLATRIMVAISKFMNNFWWLLLSLLAAIIAFLRYWIMTKNGRKIWDSLKLKIPGINILLTKLYMARFSRTLSGLITSGVPLLDSLEITAKSVGNVIYKNSIDAVTEKVKGGVNLSDAIKESTLYPAVVYEMISVGEKTGELDKMLENLADYFEEEVDEAIKNISNLILPIFIIILGIVVGFMVLGTMLPIYNFASNIK